MRVIRWSVILVILAALPLALIAQRGARGGGGPAMALTTPAWQDGQSIPAKYTQEANQVSPALNWANAPQGTMSFVLSMEDPDVAVNRTIDTQVHWLVWNIPGSATGLPESVPQGAQLSDGSRQVSATGPVYRGPGAPANGPPHHYTISVYALDTMLDVPAAAAAPEGTNAAAHAVNIRRAVFTAMSGHILGKAVYVGLFRRSQ